VAKKIVELSEKTAALVKKALETAKNPKEKSVHKVRSNLEPAGGEFVVSVILNAHSYHLCSSIASILFVF
jgi:predicted nucleotide-binding protein (sugar kinase/HSP70/actin superfamily)